MTGLAISSLAEPAIFVLDRERFSGERLAGASAIAVFTLMYSLWAIAEPGWETVFWGLLLLLAGVPLYWWQPRKRGKRA